MDNENDTGNTPPLELALLYPRNLVQHSFPFLRYRILAVLSLSLSLSLSLVSIFVAVVAYHTVILSNRTVSFLHRFISFVRYEIHRLADPGRNLVVCLCSVRG